MFRGDAARTGARGVSTGGTGEVLWEFEIDALSVSSPAVVDGVVYVGGGDGFVYALRTTDASVIWSFETGNQVVSSPAVVDERVYIGSRDDSLYALDATTGHLLWRVRLPGGAREGPALGAGAIVVQGGDGALYAFERQTGLVRWKHADAGGAPLFVNGTVFTAAGREGLWAINATSGDVLWKYDEVFLTFFGAPAYADGVIYAGGDYGETLAIEAATGQLRWRVNEGGVALSGPVVGDQGVARLLVRGGLHLYDRATGRELGDLQLMDWGGPAAPALAGDVLFVPSGGTLYAVALPEMEILWEQHLASRIEASPAVVDGVLYIGSERFRLFALDAGAGLDGRVVRPAAPSDGENVPIGSNFAIFAICALALVTRRLRR